LKRLRAGPWAMTNVEKKDEPGALQGLKGKANELLGDATNDPARKERGQLQERAAEGKAAQSRLMDEERKR
jgi:uncharacterized protein YjbJ (UPF0337 family)